MAIVKTKKGKKKFPYTKKGIQAAKGYAKKTGGKMMMDEKMMKKKKKGSGANYWRKQRESM